MTYTNNFILIFICALTFAFCLSSCENFFETTIDIDAPELEPKIVVNTFINIEQDTVGIFVHPNQALASDRDFDFDAIDAEITLEDLSNSSVIAIPKVTDLQNEQKPYNYINSNVDTDFFNAENEYLLSVRDLSADYPTATAQVSFPSKSVIKNIDFLYEGGIREDGDEASLFTITFDDPADEINYYEVGIVSNYDPEDRFSRFEFISAIDLAASKGFEDDYILISDASFNGEEKSIEIKIFRQSVDDIPFHLVWRDISEEYFKYSKTLRAQDEFGDNPFTSIVQVFTNVENGLGIVSLYQEQIIPAN